MLPNSQRCLNAVFNLIVITVILLSISTHSLAQTQPRLINFQGKLTDQQGQPLDGTYTIIFSLYATATGGTALWTERHENLSISKGLVNALLGSTQSLDTPQKVEFDAPRYLGITIDADNSANSPDPEMLPRQRIIPTIQAYNADTLDGKDSTFFTNPQTDAGRKGVAEDLYEGNSKLVEKYVKQADFGKLLPRGVIAMWSGTLASIPAGWALCDGKVYTAPDGTSVTTPDLTDRFTLSVAASENPGAKGGSHSYSLTVSQLPSHSHSGTTNTAGEHTHPYAAALSAGGNSWFWQGGQGNITYYTSYMIQPAGNHSHSFNTGSVGSNQAIDNRPAYYKVAFIMKL